MAQAFPADIAAAIDALDESAQNAGNAALSATDKEFSRILSIKYRARKALAAAVAAHIGCSDDIPEPKFSDD